MNKCALGELIHFYRKNKKITQKRLCRGICAISGMCRIEKGEINVPMLVSQTLLERMGITVNRIELISDEADAEKYELRTQISESVKERKLEKAEQLLRGYETLMGEYRNLDLQFILFQRAKIGMACGLERNEIYTMLKQAEECTVIYLPEEQRELPFLSVREIDIILTMAHMDIEGGKTEQARQCLEQLRDHVKKYYSLELQENIFPKVLLMLGELYCLEEKEAEALEAARDGLWITNRGRSYSHVADLHFLYVKALWQKAKKEKRSENVKIDCVRHCKQACSLYQFEGSEKQQEVIEYMREELGWQFTISEK